LKRIIACENTINLQKQELKKPLTDSAELEDFIRTMQSLESKLNFKFYGKEIINQQIALIDETLVLNGSYI
jgi:hypothetical protein